jgi:outer membrane protein assembly factor BamD (BamD/ComL family)
MKRNLLIAVFAIFGLFIFGNSTFAQKTVEPQVQRDPILEADALHNLDVANQAFKLRKAYKAVLLRLEETMAANPTFSKMDEVLYLSGMSSYYLSIGKGNQKTEPKTDEEKAKYAPEKLRADAFAYLSQLIEQYPTSKFKGDAEKTLKILKDKK